MQTPPDSPIPFPGPSTAEPRVRRRRFGWRHLFAAAGILVALTVLVLVLSFRVGGEVRALRRAALEASPDIWDRQIEIGVGRLPVMAAKAGLSLVRLDLEPEVRAGIAAFEAADVSVWHRRPGTPEPDRAAIFSDIRTAMARRGWQPLALVRDRHELVGVFVADTASRWSTRLELAVFVMDRDDLVMVSARANPEPLVELALNSDRFPLLARR